MDVDKLFRDLRAAVSLSDSRAVLRVVAEYQPAGGPGSKVFPPTYPTQDGVPYVLEARVVDGQERRSVQLDSTPSQANRAEEGLLRAYRAGRVRVPLMQIEHSGAAPVVLTSLEFPHRYADAYLRDSLLDGTKFDQSPVGKALLASTNADASALYAQDPGSLVYGAWNSHRKGRQQKFPRVYASEVVGWDPQLGARNAGRMDPLNLTGARKGAGDDWEFTPAAKKAKDEKLSEIGHGNIAPNPSTNGGVTITSAQRIATVSLAGLDRIGFGSASFDAAVAARAVLAAYALLADRLAFGGPALWLRSGCELVAESERLEWVHRGGRTEAFELSTPQAIELFELAAGEAEKQGLPLVTEPVLLTPSKALADAIDYTLTKAAPSEVG
jgi:CRISPR-associated protein Csb1